MAEEGKLDPVVGREKKLNAFIDFKPTQKKIILTYRRTWVGKSAIAEGLALRIIQKKVFVFVQQTCCNT
jgi:ATP-dependent Clp protease ATP-binding subunit ClpC